MSCTYDKERLTAFFDGELDAAERADTERHISGCSECLRDLGEIKSAALAVKSLPRPRAPRSIAEGVSREIAGAGRLRRLDVWRRRLFLGVAAAAVLLVVLNFAYFSSTSTAPAEARYRPAPDLALVQKDGEENPDKAPTNALERQEKAANRQLASQDKGAGEGGGRRNLESDREKKAFDALPQAPPGAAAPRADAAPVPAKAEAKPQLETGAPAPKAAAAPPAPAAPSPERELAKKSAPADGKLKEMKDEALRGSLGEQAEKARALPLATAYTVGGTKVVEARARVEALAKKWAAPPDAPAAKAPAAEAAPLPAAKPSVASRAGFGRAAEPLVVEVTPAQLEELRAELVKAGATIDVGAPEELQRGGGGKDGLAAAAVESRKRAELGQDRRTSDPAGPVEARKVTLYFVEKK